MSQQDNGSVNGSSHEGSMHELAHEDQTSPQANYSIVPGQIGPYRQRTSTPDLSLHRSMLRQSIQHRCPDRQPVYTASGHIQTYQPPQLIPGHFPTNRSQSPVTGQYLQNQSDQSYQVDRLSQHRSVPARSIQNVDDQSLRLTSGQLPASRSTQHALNRPSTHRSPNLAMDRSWQNQCDQPNQASQYPAVPAGRGNRFPSLQSGQLPAHESPSSYPAMGQYHMNQLNQLNQPTHFNQSNQASQYQQVPGRPNQQSAHHPQYLTPGHPPMHQMYPTSGQSLQNPSNRFGQASQYRPVPGRSTQSPSLQSGRLSTGQPSSPALAMNQYQQNQFNQGLQHQSVPGRPNRHPNQHPYQQSPDLMLVRPQVHPTRYLTAAEHLQSQLYQSGQTSQRLSTPRRSNQHPNQYSPDLYLGPPNVRPGLPDNSPIYNVPSQYVQRNTQRQMQQPRGTTHPMVPPISQTTDNAGVPRISGDQPATSNRHNIQPQLVSSPVSPRSPVQKVLHQSQPVPPVHIRQTVSPPTPTPQRPQRPQRPRRPQALQLEPIASPQDTSLSQQRRHHDQRSALSQRPTQVLRPTPMAWTTYRVNKAGKRVAKTVRPPQGTYKISQGIHKTDYSDPRDFSAPTEEEQKHIWNALKPTREAFFSLTQVELSMDSMRCISMGYNASWDEIKRKFVEYIFDDFSPDRITTEPLTEIVYHPSSELPGYSEQGQVSIGRQPHNPKKIKFFENGELMIKPEDHLFKLQRWYGLVEDHRFAPNWPYKRERNAKGILVQNEECCACMGCRMNNIFCHGFREHVDRKCKTCERLDLQCSNEEVILGNVVI